MIGIVGHFNTTFAPKTECVFFNLLRQNAVDIQKGPFLGLRVKVDKHSMQ